MYNGCNGQILLKYFHFNFAVMLYGGKKEYRSHKNRSPPLKVYTRKHDHSRFVLICVLFLPLFRLTSVVYSSLRFFCSVFIPPSSSFFPLHSFQSPHFIGPHCTIYINVYIFLSKYTSINVIKHTYSWLFLA